MELWRRRRRSLRLRRHTVIVIHFFLCQDALILAIIPNADRYTMRGPAIGPMTADSETVPRQTSVGTRAVCVN
jgi:hypothetical protein